MSKWAPESQAEYDYWQEGPNGPVESCWCGCCDICCGDDRQVWCREHCPDHGSGAEPEPTPPPQSTKEPHG